MAGIWLRNPYAILADEAAGGLVVEDCRIVEIVPGGARPSSPVATTVDLAGHVVLPGFVDAHHHAYRTLTRTLPETQGRGRWETLRRSMPLWGRLDADALELACRLAFAEALLRGYTTVVDHQDAIPAVVDDVADVAADVARETGVRLVIAHGGMDVGEDEGALPPKTITRTAERILEDAVRVIARHHRPGTAAGTEVALAPSGTFAVSRWLWEETAALASLHQVRLHTHLAETEEEERYCRARFGCRPLDALEAAGWLGPRTWIAHGTRLSGDEIARLGRCGVAVAHCPASELATGSAIAPVVDLAGAGVPVGLGSDGDAGMAVDVRLADLGQRLRYGPAAIGPHDALRWATEGGAACVGRTDLGRIAPGAAADLACYRADDVALVGAEDAFGTLVRAGLGRPDRVMVAGRWRVMDGRLADFDVDGLRRRHAAAVRDLRDAA